MLVLGSWHERASERATYRPMFIKHCKVSNRVMAMPMTKTDHLAIGGHDSNISMVCVGVYEGQREEDGWEREREMEQMK